MFAPGNVVIHLEAGHRRIVRVMFFKMSIYARSGRLGLAGASRSGASAASRFVSAARGSAAGLRHSWGVAAVQAGVPLTTIAAVLGHADVGTTAIYATAIGAEARELVARLWT